MSTERSLPGCPRGWGVGLSACWSKETGDLPCSVPASITSSTDVHSSFVGVAHTSESFWAGGGGSQWSEVAVHR